MPVLNNTITADDIESAMSIEMSANFRQEYDRLAEILGIFEPEVVAAGTTLYQYVVTGSLNDATVAEGDEVPLSHYEVDKTPIGSVEIKPYRKQTTAQAILKGGYENAVIKTDKQMMKNIRADIIDDFFTYLANGTTTAEGTTLQMALARADASLGSVMETNGDAPESIIHFVNTFDIADYLGKADVTTQTVFGMTYLANFLGIQHIFVTNKVSRGNVYATPAENIHIYGVDFGALGSAGLDYTVSEGSLVGVNHEPAYGRVSAVTNALTGAKFLAEILDYIVIASIEQNSSDATFHTYKVGTVAGTIDLENNSIAVSLPSGTDISDVASTFTLGEGATAKIGSKAQTSGTTKNAWTSGNAKTYRVTAENGATQDWSVTLTVAS